MSADDGAQAGRGSLVQSFGADVRALRLAHGWSQERLAEKSNLNRSYIGEIERGSVIASLVTLEKLAAALKLTPSALLGRSEAADRASPASRG